MTKFKCEAEVRWFDKLTGEGMVRLLGDDYSGQSLTIYACNINGKKTWFPETACVSYGKGQAIQVEVSYDKYATFVTGLTQGTLDVEGWENLKHQDLAFRCDDDGNATTGLFKAE